MSTLVSRSRNRRSESGAAALEFGLIAGAILMPLLLGIISYGWYFYVAQTTGGAATHVSRRLAVGDCWGSGQALELVKGEVAGSDATTTLTYNPTSNSTAVIGTTQLSVTVTADGDLIGLFPMPNGGTITRTVQTMIEDTGSSTPATGSCS